MLEKLQNWAMGTRDPIPGVLTIGGCVVSVLALAWGVIADWGGFMLNLSASLVLVGPTLIVSNVVVKRIQTARITRQLTPLVGVVLYSLHEVVRTAQQAYELLGIHASLETADVRPLEGLSTALARWTTAEYSRASSWLLMGPRAAGIRGRLRRVRFLPACPGLGVQFLCGVIAALARSFVRFHERDTAATTAITVSITRPTVEARRSSQYLDLRT